MPKTKITIPAQKAIPAQWVTFPEQRIELVAETTPAYTFEVDTGEAPVATSATYMPASAADLQSKLQGALDNGKLLCTSSDMLLEVPDTIDLLMRNNGFGAPQGWRGNGGVLRWTGNDPAKSVVRFKMGADQCYGIEVGDFMIDGGQWNLSASPVVWAGRQCKAGLEFSIDASVGAVYQFKVNNYVGRNFLTYALWIEGEIYEGVIDSPWVHASNNGLMIKMGGAVPGVISNITVRTPNLRGNGGWGMVLDGAKSVDVVAGGSFINNTLGGIWANQGIRLVDGPNFENCGPAGIRSDAAADGLTRVVNCCGSNTIGNMPNLIDYRGPAGGLYQAGNFMFNGSVVKP